jgi:hypothetical protein
MATRAIAEGLSLDGDTIDKYGANEAMAAAMLVHKAAKTLTNESYRFLAFMMKSPIIRDVVDQFEAPFYYASINARHYPEEYRCLQAAGGDAVEPYIKKIRAYLERPSTVLKAQLCVRPGVSDVPKALSVYTYHITPDTRPVMSTTSCGEPDIDGEYVYVRHVLFGAPGKASTTIDLCRRNVSDLIGFVRTYETAA